MSSSTSPSSSYWCYRCSRFIRIWYQDAVVCPDCDGGFLEEVEAPPRLPTTPAPPRRRPSGDRSAFNPVIVLRGADTPVASFEFYYDDGAGSGLRPLPPSMSEFLMGSGFDRLIDQLNQIETGGPRGCHHPPASKAAVDSMPTVEIASRHVILESHCAVCTEAFEVGAKAREMPCKHIYHQDCILPWLAMRNSCPVCRHEMPVDGHGRDGDAVAVEGGDGSEEDMVGLTIWRLPGGGFAVGRFSGSRRAGERELPVVYTEMDGGFNNSGAPRRISWSSTGSRERESRGIGRALRSFFSFFGRRRSSSSSSSRSGSNSSPSSPHRNRRSGNARRTGLVGASNVAAPIWY